MKMTKKKKEVTEWQRVETEPGDFLRFRGGSQNNRRGTTVKAVC